MFSPSAILSFLKYLAIHVTILAMERHEGRLLAL